MIHALAGIDRAHTDANSDLYLPAGALLARSSNPERYGELRRVALELYGDTQDRLIAERILKACLMKPASKADLQQTAKLAAVLEKATRRQPESHLLAWECLSVALHYYRMADYEQAGTWATRSLQSPQSSRLSMLTARVIMGLVWQGRGNDARANGILASVVADSGQILQRLSANPPDGAGLWYDWTNLRTLLEEAGWREDASPRER